MPDYRHTEKRSDEGFATVTMKDDFANQLIVFFLKNYFAFLKFLAESFDSSKAVLSIFS